MLWDGGCGRQALSEIELLTPAGNDFHSRVRRSNVIIPASTVSRFGVHAGAIGDTVVGNAFQEQFLKLGLVDEKKLKQTTQEKSKQNHQIHHGKKPVVDSGQRAAQQAQAAKVERDRLLNEQRKADADKKAIAAQIKQLVADHRQPKGTGDVPYNFTDGTRIRRIYITEALRTQITSGVMAIVKSAGQYEVVPAEVAEKIRARNERCVVLLSTELPPSTDAADDPYADFKVPDDLIW